MGLPPSLSAAGVLRGFWLHHAADSKELQDPGINSAPAGVFR